jgi:hypothetical protein
MSPAASYRTQSRQQWRAYGAVSAAERNTAGAADRGCSALVVNMCHVTKSFVPGNVPARRRRSRGCEYPDDDIFASSFRAMVIIVVGVVVMIVIVVVIIAVIIAVISIIVPGCPFIVKAVDESIKRRTRAADALCCCRKERLSAGDAGA